MSDVVNYVSTAFRCGLKLNGTWVVATSWQVEVDPASLEVGKFEDGAAVEVVHAEVFDQRTRLQVSCDGSINLH